MKFSFSMPLRFTLLALTVTFAALPLVSCKKAGSNAKPAGVDYYTCTMHPSVKSQDPNAKCPICSMDLVPVMKKKTSTKSDEKPDAKSMGMAAEEHSKMADGKGKDETAGDQPGEFMVPVARQQQIGVTYATVEKRPLNLSIRTVGVVASDPQRRWDIVSRVEGYVQKLEISSRGQVVAKDQPVLTIYSPDLLTAQREFLDALQTRDDARKAGSEALVRSTERLIESSRRRLSLWNITSNQVAELEKTRDAKETMTFYSPFKGIVQNLQATQGGRVMAGDHLVSLADLSVVFVWSEFYQDELPMLKEGLTLTVTSSSYPKEKFTGKIVIIDPFINDVTRTGRVRIDVENPDSKLRPDMYVDIELEMDMGEGLAVPVSAVMPTGKRNIVFVDKGEGKLEPRFIEVDRKYGDFYSVTSGLKDGERVVNSANFLIDAESKVQGALKNF